MTQPEPQTTELTAQTAPADLLAALANAGEFVERRIARGEMGAGERETSGQIMTQVAALVPRVGTEGITPAVQATPTPDPALADLQAQLDQARQAAEQERQQHATALQQAQVGATNAQTRVSELEAEVTRLNAVPKMPSREALIAVKGVGEKLADEILALSPSPVPAQN